nr:Peptidase C1A domain containing protein [Haemonchus contortus]
MKYHAIVLCAFLCRISEASKADVLASLRAQKISEEAQRLSGESLVEYLNKNQNLFAAITPASHGYKHKLMDLKFIGQKGNIVVEDEKDFGDDIPESFDGRVHWANCSSLWYIPDQANCGSCWAVASAAAMSDRLCIASKGAKQVHLSANDILSCCEDCGQGCRGGLAIEAWNFLIDNGVVTGGDYGSKVDCCRPYPLHPCGHHGNDTYYGECDGTASTPKCKKRCQSGYRKSYTMDKFYGKYAYQLPNSVIAIQKEIMKNGPVVGSFTVFEDFSLYVKGIYKHTGGKIDGAHSVKIIGWGKEGHTPYWIIANSWNDDWGENGYFRMIRGNNECGIEDTVIAGIVRA